MQYRKKGAEDWTDLWYTFTDPVTGHELTGNFPATFSSATVPDLEPGETYEARVQALTDEEGEGPWSATGEGTANTPPAATSPYPITQTVVVNGAFAHDFIYGAARYLTGHTSTIPMATR